MKTPSRTLLSWRRFDLWPVVLSLVLSMVGLVSIYSVDLSRGNELILFPTQLIACVMGLILLVTISSINLAFFRSSAKFVYTAALILLIAVLFLGQTVRGTTGWFRIAGFSFQPAEFAKLALVVFLAWWISQQARRFDRWQFVLTSGFFTMLFVFLIMLQPDLGSSLVLLGIWFSFLFLTGVKKRYIAVILAASLVLASFAWIFFFQAYQKERLFTFINPDRDPLGAGYNVAQSVIAIGSGKFFGRGLGFGSQSQLHFLPEAQTDFIFSVIAEELGFLGAGAVLVLYLLLLWRLIVIAKQGTEDFAAYTVLGVALLFFIQVLVNIGGAVGLLPITGVTLPFLSYGGSSIVINFLLLGIVESVVRSGLKPQT